MSERVERKGETEEIRGNGSGKPDKSDDNDTKANLFTLTFFSSTWTALDK